MFPLPRLLIPLAALALLPGCGAKLMRLYASPALKARAEEVPVSGHRFGEFVGDNGLPPGLTLTTSSIFDTSEADFELRFEEAGQAPLQVRCHVSYVRRPMVWRGFEMKRAAPETRCTYAANDGTVAGELQLGMTGEGRLVGTVHLGEVQLQLRGTERFTIPGEPRPWRKTTYESGVAKGFEVLQEGSPVGLMEYMSPQGVWLPRPTEPSVRRAAAAAIAVLRGGQAYLVGFDKPSREPNKEGT